MSTSEVGCKLALVGKYYPLAGVNVHALLPFCEQSEALASGATLTGADIRLR